MRIEVLTTAELRNRVANNWRPDELVLVDNKRSRKDRLYGRKIMEVKVHPINWDGVINGNTEAQICAEVHADAFGVFVDGKLVADYDTRGQADYEKSKLEVGKKYAE